jgi:hypothetical protein
MVKFSLPPLVASNDPPASMVRLFTCRSRLDVMRGPLTTLAMVTSCVPPGTTPQVQLPGVIQSRLAAPVQEQGVAADAGWVKAPGGPKQTTIMINTRQIDFIAYFSFRQVIKLFNC